MSNTKALEEERRNSLKKSYLESQGITENEETDETGEEESSEVQEESSGKDENSSYLENDENEEDSDEIRSDDSDKKSLLENVFNGDTAKLEKGYLESQREFNRLNQTHKQILEEYDSTKNLNKQVENVLNQNPALRSLFEKATQGEDVESLITQMSKPSTGKSTGVIGATDNGKLEVENEFLPTNERLIELGYLKEDLSNLTDFDRDRAILNARSKYLAQETPKLIQQQVNKSIQTASEQKKQDEVKQKLTNINTRRFEEGFDQAVINYGLNFTKEHKDLFDEIYAEAKSMRDPSDQRLIRENAVDIATREVLARSDIQIEDTDTKQTETEQKSNTKKRIFTTSGKSGKGERAKDTEPKTIEEKMTAKRLESIERDFGGRKNLYKRE